MTLSLQPITFAEAAAFVGLNHRHHRAPVGWKFGVAAVDDAGQVVGVVMVGRPVARFADNGDTLEVLRCCTDGTKFHLYHYQDCCESVSLEDVCGDLEDLVGSPITMAEEVEGEGEAPERTEEEKRWIDSETWTFYKFATEKGYVTLRWLGSSNGYYSESASFSEIKPKN